MISKDFLQDKGLEGTLACEGQRGVRIGRGKPDGKTQQNLGGSGRHQGLGGLREEATPREAREPLCVVTCLGPPGVYRAASGQLAAWLPYWVTAAPFHLLFASSQAWELAWSSFIFSPSLCIYFYFRIMSPYSCEPPSVPRVFSEGPPHRSLPGPLEQPKPVVIDEAELKWLPRASPSRCPSQPHPAFQDSNTGLKWLFDFRNLSSRTKVHAKHQHPSFWLIAFLSPHCVLDLNLLLSLCNVLAFLSRGACMLKSTSASQIFT